MKLTNELKTEIRKIFKANSVKRTWLFDEVPAKRMNTAITRFGYRITEDEEIILLHDSTTFGSAREGLILTTTALYWKEIAAEAKSLSLEKVISFNGKGIAGTWMEIHSSHPEDSCRIITEHGGALAILLNLLIPLLMNNDKKAVMVEKHQFENWKCTGCKAVNEAKNSHCEWCRKPKFIEREQSITNQSLSSVDVDGILNNVNNTLGNLNMRNMTQSSTIVINGEAVSSFSEMSEEQKKIFNDSFNDFENFFNN